MGYRKAEEILPSEIIKLIQQYVDGENIYIPRKIEKRLEWGTTTQIKKELTVRNRAIYQDYLSGKKVQSLSSKYFLSEKSIERIIREQKRMKECI